MSLDVYLEYDEPEVFRANITHNLNRMAVAAEIYEVLWRPEEAGITRAADLIQPLEAGLARLRADPQRYAEFNPPNGWGNYDVLVRFVQAYLDACKAHPSATVRAWR